MAHDKIILSKFVWLVWAIPGRPSGKKLNDQCGCTPAWLQEKEEFYLQLLTAKSFGQDTVAYYDAFYS